MDRALQVQGGEEGGEAPGKIGLILILVFLIFFIQLSTEAYQQPGPGKTVLRRVAEVPYYGPGLGGWRKILLAQGNTVAELGVGGAARLGSATSFYQWLLQKAHLLSDDLLVGGKAALPPLPNQPGAE